jgi:hypothetical protein
MWHIHPELTPSAGKNSTTFGGSVYAEESDRRSQALAS